jgi:F-type H+-transporting ATPase subunit alpha
VTRRSSRCGESPAGCGWTWHLVELLKQPNYSPYPVEEEIVAVWSGTSGKLDDIPVPQVRRFEQQFIEFLRHARKDLLASIANGTWDDDVTAQLDAAIAEFKQQFQAEAEAASTEAASTGQGQ